jgi:hypothetical protein
MPDMRRLLTLVIVLGTAPLARAEIQKSGQEAFPSKHALSTHMGWQAGFGGKYGSPSGFKLEADYAYRFHPMAWFNLRAANTFGVGGHEGLCAGSFTNYCYRGGWDFEISGGVELKFPIKQIPLVVEVPLLIGVDVLYNRDCGDNGAAPVVRPGAGVKYFITQKIGLGAMFNFAFGPGIHGSAAGCFGGRTDTYVDFYGAFDFLIGAEFIL